MQCQKDTNHADKEHGSIENHSHNHSDYRNTRQEQRVFDEIDQATSFFRNGRGK